jgi:hypothetical protein
LAYNKDGKLLILVLFFVPLKSKEENGKENVGLANGNKKAGG